VPEGNKPPKTVALQWCWVLVVFWFVFFWGGRISAVVFFALDFFIEILWKAEMKTG